jgi:S1-C subfamily serine protease
MLLCSYILTNRHVVGSGPFWGHCVFDNHEEVDCYPVYRDPVHDFGILRYDPKAIKYMHVDGLTLSPDQAKGAFDNRKGLQTREDWRANPCFES